MPGFLIDDSPKEDTIPFGGIMVRARIDSAGNLVIPFPSHVQALLSVRSHLEQVRHLGVNMTPAPTPAVVTETPAPSAEHVSMTATAPAALALKSEPEQPVKRGRGRPRKNPLPAGN